MPSLLRLRNPEPSFPWAPTESLLLLGRKLSVIAEKQAADAASAKCLSASSIQLTKKELLIVQGNQFSQGGGPGSSQTSLEVKARAGQQSGDALANFIFCYHTGLCNKLRSKAADTGFDLLIKNPPGVGSRTREGQVAK